MDSFIHKSHKLEVNILNKILIISTSIIFIYAGYDHFYLQATESLYQAFVIWLIYSSCFLLVNKYENKA